MVKSLLQRCRIVCILTVTVFALLFVSCDIDIGLGSAVDTEPPAIEFSENTSDPKSNAVIRGKFAIRGTWKDDGALSGVKVYLTNASQGRTVEVNGSITLPPTPEENGTWIAVINPFAPTDAEPDGLDLIDGIYDVRVEIKDKGEHVSTITRSYTIDNTAPVLILSRPSSPVTASEEKIESYGQFLTFEGQAADDNDVEYLEVKFYNKDEPEKLLKTKIIKNIPPTISLDVAKFLDTEDDTYSKIYGDDKVGEKKYICKIFAYDGARAYPVSGQRTEADDKGNVEDSYILWTDWEQIVNDFENNGGSNLKVPDLYHIKSRTYNYIGGRAVIDARALNSIWNSVEGKLISESILKLNPENSPTYTISGLALGAITRVENDTALTVQLAKGLDKISLDTDNMKVYLLACDENGKELAGAERLYPTDSQYSQRGDGQFLTKITKTLCKNAAGENVNLVYGQTYIIGVEGRDTAGNTILPSFDGKKFIINFKAKSIAPEVDIVSPSEPISYFKKGKSLTIKGTVAVPDGYPNLKIKCKKDAGDSKEIYKYTFTDADKISATEYLITYGFEYTISPVNSTEENVVGFDQTKSATYDFEITSDLDEMTTPVYNKTVLYDIDGPKISVDSMLPVAYKYPEDEEQNPVDEYLNGNVIMKVSVIDDYDKVEKDKSWWQIVAEELPQTITEKHYFSNPTKEDFIIDTKAITNGAKDISIKIHAEDRAGNFTETVNEYKIDQSTDNPVIRPYIASDLTLKFQSPQEIKDALNNAELKAAGKNKKSILTTGSPLQIRIIDDDGIKSYEFKISDKETGLNLKKPAGFNQEINGTPTENILSYTLPTIPGKYKFSLSVTDKYDNTTAKEFWVLVSSPAPVVTISETIPQNKIITLAPLTETARVNNTITNVISIDSGYENFTVTRKEDGCDAVTLKFPTTDNPNNTILNDHSFTDTFTPSANRTSNKVTYTVSDENDNAGERVFEYYVDSTKPVVDVASIKVPSNTDTEKDSFIIEAKAADTAENDKNSTKASGISKIQYTFDKNKSSANIVDVTNGSSLKEEVRVEKHSYAFNKEGAQKLYIRAFDEVGNIGEWVEKEFMYDKSKPSVNISSYYRTGVDSVYQDLPNITNKEFQAAKKFNIKGTASDGTGLSSFEIWQKKSDTIYTDSADGKIRSDLGLKLNISKDNITDGTWEITDLPRNANGETLLESGNYTYTVIAVDNSAFGDDGSKKNEQTVLVSIDIEPPRVKINFANGDSLDETATTLDSTLYGLGSISGTAYPFNGQAADDILKSATGLRELFYAFTEDENQPADSEFISYGNPSGGNWNIPLNLGNGKNGGQGIVKSTIDGKTPETLYEGQKYFWVYLYDNAGNKSIIKHVGFMVDQSAPVIDDLKVFKSTDSENDQPEENGTIYIKDPNAVSYTLSGKVSDANTIKKLIIKTVDVNDPKKQIADIDLTSIVTAEDSDGTWSTPSFTSQGNYVHTVVAYDGSGKTIETGKITEKSKSVIFDIVPPTIELPDFNASTPIWISGTGEYYFNGTAGDVGSGLKEISIKIDNYDYQKLPLSSNWNYKFALNHFEENDETSEHTVYVKAIDNAENTTEVPYKFRYDKAAPEADLALNVNGQYVNAASFANNGIVISGYAHDGRTATTGRNVKTATLTAQKAGSDTSTPIEITRNLTPGTTFGDFSKALAAADFADGTWNFTLEVKDMADKSPASTSTCTASMIVDKTPPSSIAAEFTDLPAKTTDKTKFNSKTSNAKIKVTFTEANPKAVYYYVNDYSKTAVTDPTYQTATLDWTEMSLNGTTATRDLTFSDGHGKVYIKVVDKADNVAYLEAPLTYEVDTKAPDVCTIESAAANGVALDSSYLVNGAHDVTITVKASDYNSNRKADGNETGDDYSRIKSVKLTKIEATEINGTEVTTPTNANQGIWTITIPKENIPQTDGSKKVYVTVKDTFGNSKQFPVFSLLMDKTPPVVEAGYSIADSYAAGNIFYINNKLHDFKVSGVAKDTLGIGKVKLELTKFGNTSGTPDATLESSDSAFTFTLPKDTWQDWTGDVSAKITAIDKAQNVSTAADSKSFTIKFDITAPAANNDVQFGGTAYTDGFITNKDAIQATATFEDNGSGVSTVHYWIFNSQPAIPAGKTTLAEYQTAFEGEAASPKAVKTGYSAASLNTMLSGFTEGKNYIVFAGVDNVGNAAADSTIYTYEYDKTLPLVNLELKKTTESGSESVNGKYLKASDLANVTLSGYAHDGRGENAKRELKSATLKVTKDGTAQDDIDITTADGFAYVTTAGTSFGDFSKALTGYEDGAYTFTLEVEDNAGNKAISSTISVTIDTTVPQLGTHSLELTKAKGTVSISFTEKNTDSVYYFVNDNHIAGVTNQTADLDWIKMDHTGSGESLTATAKDIFFNDGSGNVYIKVVDKAGNISYTSNTALSYTVDTTAPEECTLLSVDGESLGSDASKLINGQNPVTFKVTAKDFNDNYNTDTTPAKIGLDATKVASVNLSKIGTAITAEGTEIGTATTTGTGDSAVKTGEWAITIPSSRFTELSGSKAVSVIVTDAAGNSKEFTLFSLVVDQKPPVVTLKNIKDADDSAKDTQVNGKIELSGSADELNGIEKVVGAYYKIDKTSASVAAPTDADFKEDATTGWKAISVAADDIKGTVDWTIKNIDTTKLDGTTAIPDSSVVWISVAVQDKALNTGYSTPVKVIVDQNTDRPRLSFTNLPWDSTNNAVKTYNKNLEKITGNISDDDGIAELRIVISDEAITSRPADLLTNNDYKVTVTAGAFEKSLGVSGKKYLWIYVKDSQGEEFETAATKQPYLTFNGQNGKSDNSTAIYFIVNSKDPDIKTYAYGFGATGDAATSAAQNTSSENYLTLGTTNEAGGSERKYVVFAITAETTEGVPVKSIVLNVSGVSDPISLSAPSSNASKGNITTTWYSDPIDVMTKAWTEGAHSLDFIVTDESDRSGAGTKQITIDKTGPSLSITSPAGEEVTGLITLTGTLSDNYKHLPETAAEIGFVLVDNRYYNEDGTLKEGAESDVQAAAKAASETNQNDSNTVSTWKFKLDGVTHGTKVNPKLPASEGSGDDGISNTTSGISRAPLPIGYGENDATRKLTFVFYAKDTFGNESYTPLEGNGAISVIYNPLGDRPKAAVTYPYGLWGSASNVEGYSNLSGAVRITGSAEDNNSIGSGKVFLQLDVNNDGNFDSSDVEILKDLKFNNSAIYTIVEDATNITGLTNASALGDATAQAAFWGIQVKGTNSWNYSINTYNELQIPSALIGGTGSGVYKIGVRAVAMDDTGVMGSWSAAQYFKLDLNAPTIGSAKIYSLNASGAVIAGQVPVSYEQDMYLSGGKVLRISISDKEGLSSVRYTYAKTLEELNTSTDSGTAALGAPVEAGGTKTYTVDIPLSTLTASDKLNSNTVALKVVATKASDTDTTSYERYLVHFDNDAPVIKNLTLNGKSFADSDKKIVNSNGYFTIGGQSEDTGAGFERMSYYFMRNPGTTIDDTRIYDLMIPQSTDSNVTAKNQPNYISTSALATRTVTIGTGENAESFTIYGEIQELEVSADGNSLSGYTTDSHVREGSYVQIGSTWHKIKEISGSTITLATPTTATGSQEVFFAYMQTIDNTGSEKADNGIVTKANGDDGDGMPESIIKSQNIWNYDASFFSNYIPDGPGILVTFVYDRAGNVTAQKYEVSVQNKAPRLTKLWLSTDLNRDGKFRDIPASGLTEIVEYNVLSKVGEQTNYKDLKTKDYHGERFIIKNKFAVIPEFTGGNGDIYMALNNAAESNSTPTALSSTTYTTQADAVAALYSSQGANAVPDIASFTLARTGDSKLAYVIDNADVGDASYVPANGSEKDRAMSFTFWDSTEDTISGVNSNWCYLRINDLVVNVTDQKAPNTVVEPFFWNSHDDNSLYQDSYENGHIELVEEDSEEDPSVSGKISIRGWAFDDHTLSSIWAKFDGFTPAAGTYNGTVDAKGYYKLASYANGTWTSHATSTAISGSTWAFRVTPDYLGQAGHKVKWQLDIDTSAIEGAMGNDKKVYIRAIDATGSATDATTEVVSAHTSSETAKGTSASSDAEYNKPSYQMDVVPYISGISTDAAGNNPATRSRLGRYPVRAGDTIYIKGFNFGTGTISVTRRKTAADGTMAGVGAGAETIAGATRVDANTISITAPAKSGFIHLMIGGIEASNNKNDNAKGYNIEAGFKAKETTNGVKTYGRIAANTAGTNFWTDDRYLSVWNTGTYFEGSASPHSGTLKKFTANDLDSGKLYKQQSKSQSILTYNDMTDHYMALWGSDDMLLYSSIKGSTERAISLYTDSEYCFYIPPEAVIYTVIGGIPYYVLRDDWVGGNSANSWGTGLVLAREGYVWKKGTLDSTQSLTENDHRNIIEREGNNNPAASRNSSGGYDSVLKQFTNFQMTGYYASNEIINRENNSPVNGVDYVYVSYYDSYARCLKYAAYKAGHRTTTIDSSQVKWGQQNGYQDLIPLMRTAGEFNENGTAIHSTAQGMTGGYSVVAGNDTTSNNPTSFTDQAGEWSDIVIDPVTKTPVIVYYNKTAGNIEIAHAGIRKAPSNGQWIKTTNLSKPEGSSDFGRYVSCAVDNSGNLHVTAQDASNGRLYYMYLTKDSSTYTYTVTKTVLVDATGAVGRWTDIELTTPSATGEAALPVISYLDTTYLNTTKAIKVAYYDSGNACWDALTDCAVYEGYDTKLSVMADVYESTDANSNKSKIGVGFNSNMLAVDFLRDE